MKVLVPVKQVPDTGLPLRATANGGIDLSAVPRIVNPFDEVALQAAVSLRAAGHAQEIMAVAIGPEEVEQALRQALAAGADTALHIATEAMPEPLAATQLLAALVPREHADVVLMGKQAVDDDCGCVPSMLAAMLGWPQATAAVDIAPEQDGLKVACETERGLLHLKLPTPCVISAELRLAEPPILSLAQTMKARRKPIARLAAEELLPQMPAAAVQVLKVEPCERPRRRQMLASADELVALLHEHLKRIAEEGS